MACPHSEDQWANYFNPQTPYPQSSFTDINSYDSNQVTTDSVVTTSSSPTHSSSRAAGPSTASPKPIKRRSRASKKTPTTLLNADASNFRALVQQFTGRPSGPAVITPGAQRGPVNISFGRGGGGGFSQQDQPGFTPFGYGANPNHPIEYGSANLNVGGEGLNIDELDWGTISSTTQGNDNNSHYFM